MLYFVNLISNFIFLGICVYFDIKYRIIPNKFLKYFFPITFIIIILESFSYLDVLIYFIFIKLVVFILIFAFSLILFSLKLIGGGDGKTLILLFHSLPFIYLSYFFVYFFLVFAFFIVIIIFFYNINEIIRNKNPITKILLKSLYFTDSNLNFNYYIRKIKIQKNEIIPLSIPIFLSYIVLIFLLLFMV